VYFTPEASLAVSFDGGCVYCVQIYWEKTGLAKGCFIVVWQVPGAEK
jgi:hypothetical protein